MSNHGEEILCPYSKIEHRLHAKISTLKIYTDIPGIKGNNCNNS
jgi:hypothetical protein